MSYAEIWQTLSAIDCSKHIEKKGNLSYLSWAWAWGTLMDKYPQATFKVHKERTMPDGTVECRVTVSIDDCHRMMWLPVMDNRNNSIANPTSRQISDCRMRCLVKCLALFGLAHYIYAGEDTPSQPAITEEQLSLFMDLVAKGFGMELWKYTAEIGEEATNAAFNAAPAGEKVKLKNTVRALLKAARGTIDDYVVQITEYLEKGDTGVFELTSELDEFEKKQVWSRLTDIQHRQFKQLKDVA